MKQLIILLSLTCPISSYAATNVVLDTISNWQVYNGGKLLEAYNAFSQDNRIVLSKGKIQAIDIFQVSYSDDTPCHDCNASWRIKTNQDKIVRTLNNSKTNYDFEIKTTDLQILAFDNRSPILRFYYKEEESDDEKLLFEIEIQ